MVGRSRLAATSAQRADLETLVRSDVRGEADRARAMLLTLAGWTSVYLREVRDALGESGATASLSGLSRFFRRHGITRKKGICTPPSRTGPT